METIAVIAVLVATCLTISAQGAKFDNNEMNGIRLAMAEKSGKIISSEVATGANATLAAFAAYLEEEKETELETEEWMLNTDNFFMDYHLEEAAEVPLKLENWMTDASYFGMSAYLETTTEETLTVEDWMLNVYNFYCDFGIDEATEKPLKTEAWMVNFDHFSRK